MSMKLLAFLATFVLLIYSENSASSPLSYPFIVVNSSSKAANQLEINISANLSPEDKITMIVTVAGTPVEGVIIDFDDKFIGITNITGKLNYRPTKRGLHNITANKLGYVKAITQINLSEYTNNNYSLDKCQINESLIENNIIIMIDASGSTIGEDPGRGISFIDLIKTNAIDLIQNIRPDSKVGVVVFRGVKEDILNTDILPIYNESNREELEDFVEDIRPRGDSTNIKEGFIVSEKLLNNTYGKKEIIVISDGLILTDDFTKDDFEEIKNRVFRLRNDNIEIYFIQILLSYESEEYGFKKPIRKYGELAKESSTGRVIVLNPDERVVDFINITSPKEISYEDLCSKNVNNTVTEFSPIIALNLTETQSPTIVPTTTSPSETPGFEIILAIIAFSVVCLFGRK